MVRILLIEPDKQLASTYERALKNAGYEISYVTSGQAAIDYIDERIPQLIILELQLPAHNGLEFLYEFRSYPEWQGIPVIVNTNVPPQRLSYARDVLYNELGICGWYYKPQFTLTMLLQCVNGLLTER